MSVLLPALRKEQEVPFMKHGNRFEFDNFMLALHRINKRRIWATADGWIPFHLHSLIVFMHGHTDRARWRERRARDNYYMYYVI